MATTISKNLKKTSIVIDKFGNVISSSSAETKAEEMKRKQEERARKLGMRIR